MDQAEFFAAVLAAVALTLTLKLFLVAELRWHGRLLQEIREELLKRHQGAPPALAPLSPRTRIEIAIEAELGEDSKDAWDRRFAESSEDHPTPTLPSGHTRTSRKE